MRGLLLGLAIACSALGLSACGGGGSSTASSAATSSGSTANVPSGSAALPGHPRIAAKPAPASAASRKSDTHRYGSYTRARAQRTQHRAEARQGAHHRALARKAGKAAPFLVPIGDNSIPTYGSQASATEQSQAQASLSAYLSARAAGEWSAACAQMAAAVQKQLALLIGESGSTQCPDAYAKLSARIPAQARTNVLTGPLTALRVKEGKAFALFYGPKGQQYMMPMASEGGEWRVEQLEAVKWPIGSGGEGGGAG